MVLSSLVTTSITNDLLSRIKAAYGSDAIAQSVMRQDRVSEDYEYTDETVFFVRSGQKRLYVPNDLALRYEILSEHHDIGICAHLGMDKTLDLINRTFFWPNITHDVREYVKSCPLCQMNKCRNKRQIGLLQPLGTPARRWREVSMDLITQLPRTTEGHDAIVVFVDRLTKMVHFAATVTTVTAPQLATIFFDTVYRFHGLPRVVVSDRDPRFTSKFWQELFKRCFGTKLAMSTATHLQTDGQTERANRTLEDMLRPYVSLRQNDWDKHLTPAEFAYNNSKQTSTGFTPFYLNYGRNPETPATLMAQFDINNGIANQAAADFIQQWQSDIALAKEHLAAAQQRQARLADAHRRKLVFKVGDKVLLSAEHLKVPGKKKAKLSPRYHGPFTIVEMVTPVAAKLDFPPNVKAHPVIHVSQLKPFVDSNQFPRTSANTRPPPIILGGEEYYTVEYIMDKRIVGSGNRKVTKYLVKWKGYPIYEAQWLPERELRRTKDLADMVDRFEQSSGDVAS